MTWHTDFDAPPRDLQRAVVEIANQIRYRLVEQPGTGEPVQGLTDALLWDLARHIAGCLDEYGR